jgi:carbon storage regulator
MLILGRRKGEEIIIGDGPYRIVVRVVAIRPTGVRIGLEAPPDVPIHRGENYPQTETTTHE